MGRLLSQFADQDKQAGGGCTWNGWIGTSLQRAAVTPPRHIALWLTRIAQCVLNVRVKNTVAEAPAHPARGRSPIGDHGPTRRHRPCRAREAREVIGAFIERYNNGWLLQRHGYLTPARAREKLSRRAA